jgi:hypothetical protein
MTIAEWTTYVKQYAAQNNITYKQALSQASPSYKTRHFELTETKPEEKTVTKKQTKQKEIKNEIKVIEEVQQPKKQNKIKKENKIVVDLSDPTTNTQKPVKISNIKKKC